MGAVTISRKQQPVARAATTTPGRWGRVAGHIVVYAVLAVMALFCVVPFVWVLLGSVDAHASVYLRTPNWSLHNFIEFFSASGTPQLLVNSIVIAGGGTIVCILLAMFSGDRKSVV